MAEIEVTSELYKAYRSYRKSGMSEGEAAKNLGYSIRELRPALSESKKKLDREQRDQIIEMLNSGKTEEVIVHELDISPRIVHKRLEGTIWETKRKEKLEKLRKKWEKMAH